MVQESETLVIPEVMRKSFMETRSRIDITEPEEFPKRNYDILKMRKTTTKGKNSENTCMQNGGSQPVLGRV